MKLTDLFTDDKMVSGKSLFTGEIGSATAIQLKETGILKEHITKTPALLVCVSGSIVYHDETERNDELQGGDYINIPPNVKHWLEGKQKAHLILMK